MHDQSTILVVDDERDLVELLTVNLEAAGYRTIQANNGDEALAKATDAIPDLILLDLMMPGIPGTEVARRLKTNPRTSKIPIVMLTARAAESDQIVGLSIGADDYITKPFSAKEVVARVNALLRRTTRTGKPQGPPPLVYGSIRMDLERHIVTDNGTPVRLTAKEFLLLRYFLEHRGRVLSRDLMLTDVWGYQYTGGSRTVDVHVRRLREKLPVLVDAIETVKQFGYKLG
jgi:DNA-binding response OmpR family regulator